MLSLRQLTPNDTPALLQLQCSCYPPSLWDTEDELRALVSDPSNLAIGAFETMKVTNTGSRIGLWKNVGIESLVGAVLVKAPSGRYLDRPELYSIEVTPKSRHGGVGRRLLKEALKQMPGRLVAHCTPDGKRLLEKSGRFERTGGVINRNGAVLETFITKDPAEEESGGGSRMLTVLLVAAAIIAVLYLVLGRGKPTDAPPPALPPSPDVLAGRREEAARTARAWATQLELKVTGVSCSAEGLCTIAREPGLPFTAQCSAGTCVVEACPR